MSIGPNGVVGLILLILIAIVLVYDWIALAFWDETYTISVVVRQWGRDYQIIPLTVGMLVCHLFILFGGHKTIEANKESRNGGLMHVAGSSVQSEP